AIGLFHFQDDVLLRSADVEQADNLRVAQLAQLEQDADFVGDEGPGLVPAIDELQGHARAVRQLGLPDIAEGSAAEAAEETGSGNRFHANFKHDARLRRGRGARWSRPAVSGAREHTQPYVALRCSANDGINFFCCRALAAWGFEGLECKAASGPESVALLD